MASALSSLASGPAVTRLHGAAAPKLHAKADGGARHVAAKRSCRVVALASLPKDEPAESRCTATPSQALKEVPAAEAQGHAVVASGLVAAALAGLAACDPALAAEATGDKPWFEVIVTSAALIGGYLFVAPPVILNYLRLRWYKRSMPETFFQYMLVFLFFPALLLWAPFVNFRVLPREEV